MLAMKGKQQIKILFVDTLEEAAAAEGAEGAVKPAEGDAKSEEKK